MRHTFRFPTHVQDAVRTHVRRALSGIGDNQFRQEPSYTAALLGRLIGVAYESDDAVVSIQATDIDSIGPGSAERWSGADFAITATIRQGNRSIRKAILTQVKLGAIDDLSAVERKRLLAQLIAMRRLTRSPKVMMVTSTKEGREPRMLSGVRISQGEKSPGHSLPDYFVSRILTTLDGDTRPEFVTAVQDSSLAELRVKAELFDRPQLALAPKRTKTLA